MTRREAQEPEELKTVDEWLRDSRKLDNTTPHMTQRMSEDAGYPIGDRSLPVVASCSEYQFTDEDYVCKGCGKHFEKDPTESKLWELGIVMLLALVFIVALWVGR